MTVEEITGGESKNIEFKEMLPANSEKYIKTIIAFANTQGGRLYFGVTDKTHEIVGIDESVLFQIMDNIANAVSDSCEPQIVPEICPQTVNGKAVSIVDVKPGVNRPYYLKSKGKEKGTYIRVAGTSRPANSEKIRELEMEGARISWDELICYDYPVTEEAITRLCNDIIFSREKAGLPEREVAKVQLQNWKLLKDVEGYLYASNAFALLTSEHFSFSRTQCAVFKGTERTVFLDKRDYAGPIYQQIEKAVSFVLRNIRLGATVEGLLRREAYELPIEAIREMIINAHCHRMFTEESCVQVAIYDDRLEVTSPGGLYNGLTYEEMMNGHTKLRNKAIANILNQMGYVESWGTGIKKIKMAAAAWHLPEPEFQVYDGMVRINLYRNPTFEGNLSEFGGGSEKQGNSSEKSSEKEENTSEKDTKEMILQLMETYPDISAKKIAMELNLTSRAVEKQIKGLREERIIVRHGAARGGYWEVKK